MRGTKLILFEREVANPDSSFSSINGATQRVLDLEMVDKEGNALFLADVVEAQMNEGGMIFVTIAVHPDDIHQTTGEPREVHVPEMDENGRVVVADKRLNDPYPGATEEEREHMMECKWKGVYCGCPICFKYGVSEA